MRALLGVCLLLFAAASARAAEITVVRNPSPNGVPFIFIRGELTQGDALEFETKAEGIKRALVVLSSPGGAVAEGLAIGAAVRTQGLATMVVDECASACALVWLSGVRRYYGEGMKIGFHAAYRVIDGKPTETGMANAEIGAFLAHLGLSREAIRFITSAPPNGMRWMTLEDAKRLNISVVVGQPVSDPSGKVHPPAYEAKPVKPNAARDDMYDLATVYSDIVTARGCKDYYRVDDAALQRMQAGIIADAQKKYGDQFLPVLQNVLSRTTRDQKQEGMKRTCDQNREMFRSSGLGQLYLN
ncbi:MAG: hypothetical protein DI537_10665 [Stutzerimonas stutzeri]|nr:MAG: hypothetical protein DI537_10665 [Stutzerimonas stutzeri]